VRMAGENRDWGYGRIEGALSNLGHKLGRTIAKVLKRHGIEPAPERKRKTTCKEFLAQHWEVLVAEDFFTVEVWTRQGAPALHGAVLYRVINAKGRDCRHRLCTEPLAPR
jgi:putative transposase